MATLSAAGIIGPIEFRLMSMEIGQSPVFEQPWHAQLFALTVQLHTDGCFEWSDWAQLFGATLKTHGVSKQLNGGDDYFAAWLAIRPRDWECMPEARRQSVSSWAFSS